MFAIKMVGVLRGWVNGRKRLGKKMSRSIVEKETSKIIKYYDKQGLYANDGGRMVEYVSEVFCSELGFE